MDRAGIRGIRFTQFDPNTATTTMEMIEPLAKRVQALGWHVQIHLRADQVVAAADMLLRLPGTIVFDHLGRLVPPEGLNHPAFEVLRRMFDNGRTWMKLSGAYFFGAPPDYAGGGQCGAGVYRACAGADGVGQRLAAPDREGQARRRRAVRSAGRLGAGRSRRGIASWSTIRRSFTASRVRQRRRRRADRGRLPACRSDGSPPRRRGPWCRNSGSDSTSTSWPADISRSIRWPSKRDSIRRLVTFEPQVRPSSQRGASIALSSGWPCRTWREKIIACDCGWPSPPIVP